MSDNRPTTGRRLSGASLLWLPMAMALLFSAPAIVDLDLWHQLAFARQWFESGRFPREDIFAYTASDEPYMHHEWGFGVLMYVLCMNMGGAGLLGFRYAMMLSIGLGTLLLAVRRGTRPAVAFMVSPLVIAMLLGGLTAGRAQVITLLFTVVALYMIHLEASGRRWWVWLWLAVFPLWINLHGGFVFGFVVFGLWGVERIARREPIMRVLFVGVAMTALVAMNPYGIDYYGHIVRSTLMPRPGISEWRPLWADPGLPLAALGMSIVILVYALVHNRWRCPAGILLLVFSAIEAALHGRNLPLYAVIWAAYVPPLLTATPMPAALERFTRQHSVALRATWVVAVAALIVAGVRNRVWEPLLPANPGDHPVLTYPVGAVTYLSKHGVEGRMVVPFTVGAYVSWKLHPSILVSLDSRYEAAYDEEVFETHVDFYRGSGSGSELLERYPSDLVLLPSGLDLTNRATSSDRRWEVVYRDSSYVLIARSDWDLPFADRTRERIHESFKDALCESEP